MLLLVGQSVEPQSHIAREREFRYTDLMGNRVNWRKVRGTSLLVVFLLIPTMVLMARAVHWLSQTSAHQSIVHTKMVTAQYLIEAGQSHALAKLKQDANWTDGFDGVELDNVSGSYSLSFNRPGQEYQPGQSVNNIMGDVPVDGPRGPATVQPGDVELVVFADSNGFQTTGDTVYKAKTQQLPAYGLGASGNIVLKGDVAVRGIQSLANPAEVDAGIHSNNKSGSGPAITWKKNSSTDLMKVKGRVTAASDHDQAISLEGTEGVDYQLEGLEKGTAAISMPQVNIKEAVASQSALSPPTLSEFGTTHLSRGASYHSGDLTLQGDLRLNGHKLYVEGSLIVNGSISGDGAVYVTGDTSLKGDTKIHADEAGVALFSHGSVALSGFDGLEYLKELRKKNSAIDHALGRYDSAVVPVVMRRAKGGNKKRGEYFDDQREQQIPGLLQAFNQANVEGDTAQFIKKQLKDYSTEEGGNVAGSNRIPRREGHGYRATSPVAYGPTTTVRGFLTKGRPQTADLSKIGRAYFQGLIVSDNYVKTDNQVSVVGCLWATGENKESKSGLGNQDHKPGDIVLNNGTEIVLNKEVLERPEAASVDIAEFELKAWLR